METFIYWLDIHPAFWPLFIFLARIADVTIGTLRTVFVIRGRHIIAPLLGFFEVIIWVTAITGVITHLNHWYNIIAYAAGFAVGNAVGILLEKKLAIGMQAIRLISCTKSAAVASGLRLAGYRVTEVKGHGYRGDLSISFIVVPRRETTTILKAAQGIDPDVFCTVEDVRSTSLYNYRSPVPPTGWRAKFKKK